MGMSARWLDIAHFYQGSLGDDDRRSIQPMTQAATPDTRPPSETDRAALLRHARVVAELRRPGACAGATEAPGLIETHLSSVLLTSSLVYKLKKPVLMGFVDFSTVSARREACEQELRLNRRTAPRWYQAVVAVRQTADGARITAPGDPLAEGAPVIDWAVQMRRFDDSQRLDRLAQRGELTGARVDSLAAVVARFHDQQPPAPPGFGRAETTRHWARENLVELAALLPEGRDGAPKSDQAAVAALQRWTEARGAALAGLMDLRCRTGHVREVHGDLHLANIVWSEGAPVLFDALEFNDTLRHIDTLGDLAFTFMDLQAQGLPHLAWRFISAALEASGDWGALPLLAWWSAYRAAVRAKVALLGAVGQTDVAAQQAARARARHDRAGARALAGLAPAPTLGALPGGLRLVLMCGLAGAGKSRVAGALAERLCAVRVRSDVERKRLFASAPTARAVPGLYSPDATRRTYERLQELAQQALDAGVSVVIDASSLRRSERDALRLLAARHGVRFCLLVCEAPPAVLQARVQQRQRADTDASDATSAVLAFQQGVAEWPGADEAADTVHLDTDRPWSALAAAIETLKLDLAARAGPGPSVR
jgi:aminoglycoside phosphotransferase family enzyme/predicted kinase